MWCTAITCLFAVLYHLFISAMCGYFGDAKIFPTASTCFLCYLANKMTER